MKKSYSILFLVCFSLVNLNGQTLYTTGNVHEIENPEAYFRALNQKLDQNQENYLLINGDVIDGKLNVNRTNRLLEALNATSFKKIIFNTGDADWAYSGRKGWETAVKLDKLISDRDNKKFLFPIDDACPGPEEIKISDNTTLIIINTQWWNHPYLKPGLENADCDIATPEDFVEELDDIINENESQNIIIAGHYPVISYGTYGGYFNLGEHFTPFPVVGSFKTAFHTNIGNSKDITNAHFRELRGQLDRVLHENGSLIYLSSHEQNIQVIPYEDNYLINSGAPVKGTYLKADDRITFGTVEPGLIRLRYDQTGAVSYNYLSKEASEFTINDSRPLLRSICDKSDSSLPRGRGNCNERSNVTRPGNSLNQYTTRTPGAEYKAKGLKKAFFGQHHRDSWTTPVQVPYLDLDTTFSGLTVLEKGGGRQTKSLKLKGGNGMEYTFRSVNKDPVKALDYKLRQSVIAEVVRDQTTTQHPFGAIVTDPLLNKIDILHPHPKLYVLPAHDRLGPYNDDFANTLGMLEEKPFSPDDNEYHYAGAEDVLKSYKLFRELYEDGDNKVDQKEYILARTFDIWVGDWGRHEGNWKWAAYEKDKGELYRPIPRDRDHVFSVWDGFFPWLADREWAKPSGEHFGKTIKDIRSLTWPARHMDRLVANEMTRKDWIDAARRIQTQIDDEDIKKAVRQMPEETYAVSGPDIEAKLIQRKKVLDKYAEKQYLLLAKEVDIVGSEDEDHFEVTRNENGTVTVMMQKKDEDLDDQPEERVFYQRTFYPKETKEIRLFGLDDDDRFCIKGEADRSILIRVIGGPGIDEIIDESETRSTAKQTLIYERGDNTFNLSNESRLVRPLHLEAYNYKRTAFTYNTYLPLPYFGFNANDGLFLSLGLQFINQKYGKPGFSSQHALRTFISTESVRLFRYDAQYRHVLGSLDLLMGGKYADSDRFAFFYGLGNETVFDQDLRDNDFYNIARTSWNLYTGLSKRFLNKSSAQFMVRYEGNEPETSDENILSTTPDLFGIGQLEMLELEGRFDLDFRDNGGLPYKGTRLFVNHIHGELTNETDNYGVFTGFIEYYASTPSAHPFTFALRGGGSESYGNVPFYKLPSIGQNQCLRGFQANRFAGESMWFLNSELRYNLANLESAFVPLKFGLKVFYDVGQVYYKDTESADPHSAYGGGFYMVPYNENFTLSLTMGFSDEESGLLQIGVGTPLR